MTLVQIYNPDITYLQSVPYIKTPKLLIPNQEFFYCQLSKQTCNKNFKKIKMLQKMQQKNYFKKNVAEVATKK
jgi:hypothetical protein